MRRLLISVTMILSGWVRLEGQQDATLFFMHSTPQANFVNPAVRNDCKWMLGLPVLSSFHVEYGNSGFSVMQLIHNLPDSTIQSLNLNPINYITTELYINLFFLSLWHKDNFITLSVNDKADLFIIYPKDALALALHGNAQFIGETANLSHTSAFLNYRREYAFGLTKQPSPDLVWGVRAKLLFGKLNVSFLKSTLSASTQPVSQQPNTYDLNIISNWQINSYLPMSVTTGPDQLLNTISFHGSPGEILLNHSNQGVAFDLGFIKNYSNDFSMAGSLLDLGIIHYSSQGNSFAQHGNFTYTGPINNGSYFSSFLNTFKNVFGVYTVANSYVSYLNPAYYLGATYNFTNSFTMGTVISGRIIRYLISSGITFSANKTLSEALSVSISYSYLYNSFNNVGAGIKFGKSPVQFYAVSDHIPGLIKPLETKNINLRFGLQFNFGCKQKDKITGCGCGWLKKELESDRRNQELQQKKQTF